MAIILNIDTALDTASISLAENGEVFSSSGNEEQHDHASWIQVAIKDLMHDSGIKLSSLAAVGVSIGPGSYTGLRIGLSTAKGLCYALRIPLVVETSLKALALSAIEHVKLLPSEFSGEEVAFCPMIDARRMEVFTALYDHELSELQKPAARILESTSFDQELKRQKILFLGNGSAKFQAICHQPGAIFKKIPLNPASLAALTYRNFIGNNFADLAYTEPLYLKEFFSK